MPIIIVIEPHPLLRLGILQLLSDIAPDVKLEGADYAHLSNKPAEPTHCDLLLLSVPSLEDIYELSTAADQAYSPRAMLLLSENTEMPNSAKGLPASVAGHVPKNVSHEVLQASVRLVLAGGTCFPLGSYSAPTHTPQSLQPLHEPLRWPPPHEPVNKITPGANSECQMLGLTPRQYEVLVLLARGYPMKTVGRYLNISVATAKAHTETLYQRLDVHNRNAAVYAAVSRGATLGWASISKTKLNGNADTPTPDNNGQPGISFKANGLLRQSAGAGS